MLTQRLAAVYHQVTFSSYLGAPRHVPGQALLLAALPAGGRFYYGGGSHIIFWAAASLPPAIIVPGIELLPQSGKRSPAPPEGAPAAAKAAWKPRLHPIE